MKLPSANEVALPMKCAYGTTKLPCGQTNLTFQFCCCRMSLGDIMKEDKLGYLSMELSVDILNLCKKLKSQKETVISNQIGRSATSICANIAESKYAHGRADFIAKLQIALKEASETGKWLEMLYKTEYIDTAQYKKLDRLCSTIRVLLIKSINTAKSNQK